MGLENGCESLGYSAARRARHGEISVRPEDAANLFDVISRIIFGIAAGILMLLALLLIADVVVRTASTFLSWQGVGFAALTGIGYVVVAVAVFDVAKYLFDEEVIRAREMRAASETRRSLTRFISTIAIAVFLEALVTVFRVSQEDVTKLLYPTLLLGTAILLVVGLGIYQRLSAEVEERVGHKDQADHAKNSK
jgi:hypothetical protein